MRVGRAAPLPPLPPRQGSAWVERWLAASPTAADGDRTSPCERVGAVVGRAARLAPERAAARIAPRLAERRSCAEDEGTDPDDPTTPLSAHTVSDAASTADSPSCTNARVLALARHLRAPLVPGYRLTHVEVDEVGRRICAQLERDDERVIASYMDCGVRTWCTHMALHLRAMTDRNHFFQLQAGQFCLFY